jgi:hypothetical protein
LCLLLLRFRPVKDLFDDAHEVAHGFVGPLSSRRCG